MSKSSLMLAVMRGDGWLAEQPKGSGVEVRGATRSCGSSNGKTETRRNRGAQRWQRGRVAEEQ
eukprot:5234144-Pleurochrysis_carterae.AAC.1